LRKTLILMLFVLSALFANTVHSVYAADLAAGEQVFSANCSACHAGGNNAIMPEKTLKKDALEENSMDIDNVANYVLSQSEKGW